MQFRDGLLGKHKARVGLMQKRPEQGLKDSLGNCWKTLVDFIFNYSNFIK